MTVENITDITSSNAITYEEEQSDEPIREGSMSFPSYDDGLHPEGGKEHRGGETVQLQQRREEDRRTHHAAAGCCRCCCSPHCPDSAQATAAKSCSRRWCCFLTSEENSPVAGHFGGGMRGSKRLRCECEKESEPLLLTEFEKIFLTKLNLILIKRQIKIVISLS